MSVVVTVYILRELVSQIDCNCSSRPRVQSYIAPRLTRGRPTPNGNLVVAELRRWVSSRNFIRRFDLSSYTQFTAVDVDALPRLLFMLFSVAVLPVTGLFPDVGGLIIFCSLFPLMFALVSFTPVTSLPVTMVTAFLFCFPGSFSFTLPFLTCGVFLHPFPFCTCADKSIPNQLVSCVTGQLPHV